MSDVSKSQFQSRFWRSESGSITAESVLWLPIFMVFFSIIADVSLVLHGQSKAMKIAQDANRHASTGFLDTNTEMETLVTARVSQFSPNATVTSTISNETVGTTITLPTNDLFVVGFLGLFTNMDITVSSLHLKEI
ncbi:MAG: TadE/TadG family type IV pilus assembly protein [Boseongicola sp.]